MFLVSAAQAARNTFGGRGVGVFLEEMMLDLPGIVVPKCRSASTTSLQRLVEESGLVAVVPGLRQLVFIEDPEPHR